MNQRDIAQLISNFEVAADRLLVNREFLSSEISEDAGIPEPMRGFLLDAAHDARACCLRAIDRLMNPAAEDEEAAD